MNFLHAFMQKLTPETPPATLTEDAANSDSDWSLSGVMDHFAPLIELQQRRQLISVQLEGNPQIFQTLVLDINFSQNLLIIDELFPTQPRPAQGQQLYFNHQRHGQVLHFAGTLLNQQSIGGSPCYLVALPDTLAYRQRRRHPRLILEHRIVPVRLQSPNRAHWFARVINLSASGIRLQINGDKTTDLNRGSRLPSIDLTLGNNLPFQCEGRVRSFRFLRRPSRQTEISVEFVGLTPEKYSLLSQYVDRLLAMDVAA